MKIGDDEASRQMIIKSVTVDLTRYIGLWQSSYLCDTD